MNAKMKLIFFILTLFFTMSGYAVPSFDAQYEASGAGLNLMSAQFRLTVENEAFSVRTKAQTKGLLGFFLDAESIFNSSGKIIDKQFVTDSSSMTTFSKKKVKKRVVDLKNKAGYLDYQSAVLSIMNLDKSQDKTFYVSDGKRDLKITFLYQGKRVIDRVKNSLFAGEADYYTVFVSVVGGKKSGWFFNRMKDATNSPLHVYFADVLKNDFKVLVRADFDTNVFGVIRIHLTSCNPHKREGK